MFTRGYPYHDSSTFSKFGHSIIPVTSQRELDIIQPTPHRMPKAYIYIYIYIYTYIYLVGGWPTPLKNMKVSWDDEIPNIWESKKCSKPPIGHIYIYKYIITIFIIHTTFVDHISWKIMINHVKSCWMLNHVRMYPLVICYIAIENDHRNSGFTQLEHGGSFHRFLYVYQNVCNITILSHH